MKHIKSTYTMGSQSVKTDQQPFNSLVAAIDFIESMAKTRAQFDFTINKMLCEPQTNMMVLMDAAQGNGFKLSLTSTPTDNVLCRCKYYK
jgi:hypothetical protein